MSPWTFKQRRKLFRDLMTTVIQWTVIFWSCLSDAGCPNDSVPAGSQQCYSCWNTCLPTNWLKSPERVHFQLAVTIYKCFHSLAPQCLVESNQCIHCIADTGLTTTIIIEGNFRLPGLILSSEPASEQSTTWLHRSHQHRLLSNPTSRLLSSLLHLNWF